VLNRPGVRTPRRGRGTARYNRGFAPSILTGAGIPRPRFAARASGLASGLALAVRLAMVVSDSSRGLAHRCPSAHDPPVMTASTRRPRTVMRPEDDEE